MRQFLESEKKICFKSLVEISDFSFKDAIEIMKAGKSSEDKEVETRELLAHSKLRLHPS